MPNSLIVAGQGVGNIIMATPLVRALKAAGHDTHFYFKCNFPGWDNVFNHPDYVNKINGELEDSYDYIFNTWWGENVWITDIKFGNLYDRRMHSHELLSNLYLAKNIGIEEEELNKHKHPFIAPIYGAGPWFENRGVVGIHAGCNPGPLWEGKKWKNYQALATKLKLQNKLTAGFGSIYDQHVLNVYYDFWNLLKPEELVSAIAQCDLFISNDTGPMHIAAAQGVPQIALVGGEGFNRWEKNDISIYAENATIFAAENLNEISLDMVMKELK